jgi:hypothetical protein
MSLFPDIAFFPQGFTAKVTLPKSAWYKADQATGKWNRAIGITAALSRSTRRTVEVVWRPAAIQNSFLLAVQTYDVERTKRNSYKDVLKSFDVLAGQEIQIEAYFQPHPLVQDWVTFQFSRPRQTEPRYIEEHYTTPWYMLFRKLEAGNETNKTTEKPETDFDWIF